MRNRYKIRAWVRSKILSGIGLVVQFLEPLLSFAIGIALLLLDVMDWGVLFCKYLKKAVCRGWEKKDA